MKAQRLEAHMMVVDKMALVLALVLVLLMVMSMELTMLMS